MEPQMTIDQLHGFLRDSFPQVADVLQVTALDQAGLTVRLTVRDDHLRPGGTVSGPAMFMLADVGVYLAILSRIGPVALAVTTNCSIDFLRKPARDVPLICQVRLLKLGRRLAVGDAIIHAGDPDAAVARASLTYSIPAYASG